MIQILSRPSEKPPQLRWLRAAVVLYGRVYHHIDIESRCPIPRKGAGIIVSNHISGLDPVLIQAVCPRLIVWMMAAEYGQYRWMRPLYNATRTIYVNRTGQDLTATRQALRVLREGLILGIFPEGKIETSPRLLPLHPGAAAMAQRAGVPLYPVKIEGSPRGEEMPFVYLKRQTVRMRFGSIIQISRNDSLDMANSKLYDLMLDL